MNKDRKIIRHLSKPASFGEWFYRMRFTVARRFIQLSILILFFGTLHFGWSFLGRPLLEGNLSTSKVLGLIPLSDPFGALQRLLAQHWLNLETLAGASLVLLFYWIVGGRVFCSWVCPMNLVTDLAAWVRRKIGIKTDFLHLSKNFRYLLLALSLVLSFLSGTAAFEWLSPQALLWREWVYGIGAGFLSALLGVFAFDLAVLHRGWCGHLCPLGAFWGIVGTTSQVKVLFNAQTCTHCADCLKVCPEPQVLNFVKAEQKGFIASGECTNCGKCISVCPEQSLNFGLRCQIQRNKNEITTQGE